MDTVRFWIYIHGLEPVTRKIMRFIPHRHCPHSVSERCCRCTKIGV